MMADLYFIPMYVVGTYVVCIEFDYSNMTTDQASTSNII